MPPDTGCRRCLSPFSIARSQFEKLLSHLRLPGNTEQSLEEILAHKPLALAGGSRLWTVSRGSAVNSSSTDWWTSSVWISTTCKRIPTRSDQLAEAASQSPKRAAANRLVQYVTDHREMIRYPEFQAKSWQIGSGPTEAKCKTTTHRVKDRGRHWDADNAESMMALAALHDSRLWHQRWTTLDSQKN